MVILHIEGQEYQIEDAIANGGTSVQQSDQLLRDALRPSFALAAGATFQRQTRADGHLHITVIKQPGPKGSQRILQCLLEAPEEVNPKLLQAYELAQLKACGALTASVQIARRAALDNALREGKAEQRRILYAQRVLQAAPAQASRDVPPGF